MRTILAAMSLVLAAPALAAAPVTSGAYNDAMLFAYDPATSEVSGYFSTTEDRPPVFSCIFYLHGKLAGGKAAIDTYYPETPKSDLIKGMLVLSDAKHFTIVLPNDHGGCGNLAPFAASDMPATFDLAAAYPWTQIAVVKSAKAYFYDAAGAATHRKGYVVKGDGVGVRAAKPGWVEVDYIDGSARASGWLKRSDLYPTP